jgi:hypothetical protein
MFLRQLAGEHGGLGGHGDGGKDFLQALHPAIAGKGLKLRGMGQESARQAHGVYNNQWLVGVLITHWH